MTSPNLRPHPDSAHEALLDQLEHQLLALTTAALDETDERPRRHVDEFAPEFLAPRTPPPGST